MVKISIVIPTLNEQEYIPKLLESIKKQTFKDYEIIVADASSRDNTRRIAKKYNAGVIKGGMPGVGRNNGAKVAKGEFLFFFDADIKLPRDFLQKSYHELKKNKIELATCRFVPLSNLKIDKVLHDFVNMSIRLSQSTEPRAPGFCIFVTKSLFDKVHGFNEKIKIAEDHDFVKRAHKFKPLRVLKSTKIYVSVRRLKKEGRLNLIKKYLLVEMHIRFGADLTKEIVKYEFANFKKSEASNFEKKLIKLDYKVKILNKRYKEFGNRNIEKINNEFYSLKKSLFNLLKKY